MTLWSTSFCVVHRPHRGLQTYWGYPASSTPPGVLGFVGPSTTTGRIGVTRPTGSRRWHQRRRRSDSERCCLPGRHSLQRAASSPRKQAQALPYGSSARFDLLGCTVCVAQVCQTRIGRAIGNRVRRRIALVLGARLAGLPIQTPRAVDCGPYVSCVRTAYWSPRSPDWKQGLA